MKATASFLTVLLIIHINCLNTLYHTTEEITSTLTELSNTCVHLKKHSIEEESNRLIYFVVEKDSDSKKKTSFLLFGEHARELITSELSLFLIQSLCRDNTYYDRDTIDTILNENIIVIVPVANPKGRKAVEQGDFCKRTNENDVDINRNWSYEWQKSINDPEENPGDYPMSEWETKALDQLYDKFSFTTFMSVHSGTLGLGIPFAYKFSFLKAANELKEQENIVDQISGQYCDCPHGPMSDTIHYVSPGNCLDYAYSVKKVKYSFAFEIFKQEKIPPMYNLLINDPSLEAFDISSLRKKSSIRSISFVQKSKHTYENSCFLQTSLKMNSENCFEFFNPLKKLHYDNTLKIWTNIIFEALANIGQNPN